jgi:hypothetical protein
MLKSVWLVLSCQSLAAVNCWTKVTHNNIDHGPLKQKRVCLFILTITNIILKDVGTYFRHVINNTWWQNAEKFHGAVAVCAGKSGMASRRTPCISVIRVFIAVFTKAGHWLLYGTKLNPSTILSSTTRTRYFKWLLTFWSSHQNFTCSSHLSPIRDTCHADFIYFYLIILIIFGETYK